MQEASARIIIDKLLRESGWVLPGDDGKVNVEAETRNDSGFADYTLLDSEAVSYTHLTLPTIYSV